MASSMAVDGLRQQSENEATVPSSRRMRVFEDLTPVFVRVLIGCPERRCGSPSSSHFTV